MVARAPQTARSPEVKRPRYPIYIPSKGRASLRRTAAMLARDGVPFTLVVEPQEAEAYAAVWGQACLLVTDFRNAGQGVSSARNFIHDHARAAGHARHWQLDDDIQCVKRLHRGRRLRVDAGVALAAMEDFTDRYVNVAQAGPQYVNFAPTLRRTFPPFQRNHRVYSCILQVTDVPFRWRGPYNEDTDFSLQCLAAGWCTLLFNVFLLQIDATFTNRGGMTDEYYGGDGRLTMARSLERRWPGVVETTRRFNRPQHKVKGEYGFFDTPLRLREDLALADLPPVDDYGLRLVAQAAVRHPDLRQRYAQDLVS